MIWVEATLANGKRLIAALDEFGAPIDKLYPKDISTPGLLYIFGLPPLRVDILNRLDGVSFSKIYKKRKTIKLEKIKIQVVDIDTLIKLKNKAGRPQDKLDVKKLKLVNKKIAYNSLLQ